MAATIRSAGKLTADEDAVALVRGSAGANDIADGMLVGMILILGVEVSVSVVVDDCSMLVELLDCCTGLSVRPVLRVLCFSCICWGSSA